MPEVFVRAARRWRGGQLAARVDARVREGARRGRGPSIGEWPVWCPPEKLPDVCTTINQLCYANRRPRGGYDFVVWTSRALRTFRVRRELVWKPSTLNQVCRLVSQLPTRDLAPRPIGGSGAMVGRLGASPARSCCRPPSTGLLYVDGIEPGAQIDLTSTRTTAWLVDPDDGHVLETFPASGGGTRSNSPPQSIGFAPVARPDSLTRGDIPPALFQPEERSSSGFHHRATGAGRGLVCRRAVLRAELCSAAWYGLATRPSSG